MGSKMKKGICLAIVLLLIGAGVISKLSVKSLTKPVEFENLPRSGDALAMDFYQNQLTQKEKMLYDTLVERVDRYQGGIITLKEPMTKREVTRATNAFFNDCANYFYAYVYTIFVGEEDVALASADENNDSEMVTKIILMLSCSNYKNVELKIDEDTSTFLNLDEYAKALEVNDSEEIKKIEQRITDTDAKVQEIMDGIPENAGQRETLDYFCNWIGEHAAYDKDTLNKLQAYAADEEIEDRIQELLNFVSTTVTEQSNIIGVMDGKAICGGYAKTLAYLCNEAGIEAHVITGIFKSAGAGHAITVVKIGDQVAYVDLSGLWSYLDGKEVKYRKEKATLNMFSPSNYLDYQF